MAIIRSTLPGGIELIEVAGSLLGGEETDEMRNAVNDCVEKSISRLLIDLSQVVYLNSAAVGVLVAALASYSRRKWQLKLCGLNKVVYSILTITKLNLVFETYEERVDAVQSFLRVHS